MDALAIISIIFAVIGILGGFLPVVPGPPLSWVALLCLYFSDSADNPVTVTALVVWFAVAALLTAFDYLMPGMMAKLTGGHKAAGRGATIGLIIGLFFTPIGMIAGSFIGAFLGELIAADQDVITSLKAAAGTFVAFILTTGAKVIYSGILLWVIVKNLF